MSDFSSPIWLTANWLTANWLTPADWAAVALSIKVAFWATLISLPFGIAAAYALSRGGFRGKSVLNGLVHLPLILPPVVTGYALLLLFGRNGMIGAPLLKGFGITLAFHWSGAVLAAAVMAFPLLVRAIWLGLDAVDPRLEQAAASLGAGKAQVFFRITLPLILPSVLAGATLCFAKAMGEFGATITFVANIPRLTQTLPSAIYTQLQVPGGEPAALRLTVVAITIAVGALMLSDYLGRAALRRMRGR